jgi:hypothetical protein
MIKLLNKLLIVANDLLQLIRTWKGGSFWMMSAKVRTDTSIMSLRRANQRLKQLTLALAHNQES